MYYYYFNLLDLTNKMPSDGYWTDETIYCVQLVDENELAEIAGGLEEMLRVWFPVFTKTKNGSYEVLPFNTIEDAYEALLYSENEALYLAAKDI